MSDDTSPDLVLLLGRLDGKLDLVLAASGDHDRRLRSLEGSRSRAYGIIAGASTVAGAIGSFITTLFSVKGH